MAITRACMFGGRPILHGSGVDSLSSSNHELPIKNNVTLLHPSVRSAALPRLEICITSVLYWKRYGARGCSTLELRRVLRVT